MYSVSINFRLELIESSAGEVEDQYFFLAQTLFPVPVGLNHALFSSPDKLPALLSRSEFKKLKPL